MKRLRNPILAAVAVLAISSPLFATNGYFLHGQGTNSKAMAGATTAIAQDAIDAETNPAASAFLKNGYSFSLALFSPNRSYNVTGAPSGYQGTFGLTPGKVTSKSDYFPMPAFGYNQKIDDKSAFTLNFSAHGGMNTDYRTATFYGSDHTGVNLMQMFASGTYSRQILPGHSLGLSAVVVGQRFKATGVEAFGMFSSDPQHVSNTGSDNSYGIGARIGYLGRINDKLSIGAAYQPKIHMSELKNYAGLFAQGGHFNVPPSVSAGIAIKPVDNFTTAVDYQKIHYTDVLSVGNHMLPNMMQSPLGTTSGAGFGWNDISVYKLGMQWQANQIWTWRAGYSYADQTVPSTEVMFNILAPGVIQNHITAGFSRQMKSGGRFNFAAMYAPSVTVSGPNPLEVPGRQNIDLKMSEWELEFGYSFGF